MDDTPFPYAGPPELAEPIADALREVVDPEIGISIVDIGLIYAVDVSPGQCRVEMTMTSAACPLGDLITADVQDALAAVLPAATAIDVTLVWEPMWTPDRMSDGARHRMGW
jgi:metal-sulfur cluster biosynthetic enzyme